MKNGSLEKKSPVSGQWPKWVEKSCDGTEHLNKVLGNSNQLLSLIFFVCLFPFLFGSHIHTHPTVSLISLLPMEKMSFFKNLEWEVKNVGIHTLRAFVV